MKHQNDCIEYFKSKKRTSIAINAIYINAIIFDEIVIIYTRNKNLFNEIE